MTYNPKNSSIISGTVITAPRVFQNSDGSRTIAVVLSVKDNFRSGPENRRRSHMLERKAYVPAGEEHPVLDRVQVGDSITIVGHEELDSWNDKHTGQTRYEQVVKVDQVEWNDDAEDAQMLRADRAARLALREQGTSASAGGADRAGRVGTDTERTEVPAAPGTGFTVHGAVRGEAGDQQQAQQPSSGAVPPPDFGAGPGASMPGQLGGFPAPPPQYAQQPAQTAQQAQPEQAAMFQGQMDFLRSMSAVGTQAPATRPAAAPAQPFGAVDPAERALDQVRSQNPAQWPTAGQYRTGNEPPF